MAVTITWADVTARAPELSAVATATQNAILADLAVLLPNTAIWGDKYNLACCYLAAHKGTLALAGGQGPAGPLTSEKIGPTAYSYAAPKQSGSGLYSSTSYGQQYEALLRGLSARVGFVL